MAGMLRFHTKHNPSDSSSPDRGARDAEGGTSGVTAVKRPVPPPLVVDSRPRRRHSSEPALVPMMTSLSYSCHKGEMPVANSGVAISGHFLEQ